MAYTLTEAARAVQKDKTTLLRAIKSGKISAVRDAVTGGWRIEPAELHRIYPVTADSVADALQRDGNIGRSGDSAEVEIRELRARLTDKDEQIADLRRRLDAESEERRRLMMLLADQRASSVPARRWWTWRRR
jgi:hypothetical protein